MGAFGSPSELRAEAVSSCEARAQPAYFVELRGSEEAGLFVEGSARQAATEEDVVAVIDGQAVLRGGLLALDQHAEVPQHGAPAGHRKLRRAVLKKSPVEHPGGSMLNLPPRWRTPRFTGAAQLHRMMSEASAAPRPVQPLVRRRGQSGFCIENESRVRSNAGYASLACSEATCVMIMTLYRPLLTAKNLAS